MPSPRSTESSPAPRRPRTRGGQGGRCLFQHLDEAGSTVSTLAQRAGMTKQAMAALVQYLEGHGYLHREPDPTDGREAGPALARGGR
ncbi:MAG: helix-turn-helix domain-containing protein [Micropruina sp.]